MKVIVGLADLPGRLREYIRQQMRTKHHVFALEFANGHKDPELQRLGGRQHDQAISDLANECARGVTLGGLEVGRAEATARVVVLLHSFTYDTAHYVEERLGERVYFEDQLKEVASAIVEAVLGSKED